MQGWVAILILLTVLRSFLFIYCILLLVYVFWVICKFMMFGLSEGYLYLSCSFFSILLYIRPQEQRYSGGKWGKGFNGWAGEWARLGD